MLLRNSRIVINAVGDDKVSYDISMRFRGREPAVIDSFGSVKSTTIAVINNDRGQPIHYSHPQEPEDT